MKVVTIENKWFTTMISHMYQAFRKSQNVKFRFKIEESDDIMTPYYTNTITSIPIYNSMLNIEYYFRKSEIYDHYSFNSKFENNITQSEERVMESLKVLSLKESNDSIFYELINYEDEHSFRSIFDNITEHKFLQYNIRYMSLSFFI